MNPTILLPATTLAGWHTLVSEAELHEDLNLGEELESYLVYLLMRFTQRAEFADSVLALDFLETLKMQGNKRETALRDVGDKCLLYSGLFSRRAQTKRVSLRYFIDVGQMAYSALSDLQHTQLAKLFLTLNEKFVSLMDVLLAMRELAGQQQLLPLEAEALWRETGSHAAYSALKRYCGQTPFLTPNYGHSINLQ